VLEIHYILIYTVSQKNMPPYFCPYLRQILTDFKNSFTGTLRGKFAIKWLLMMPPYLNSVATLPCETLMSVNLAIAAVSSCTQWLFWHFRKFRQRSQQMIRTTVDCDLSLWIPDVLNDVFVADLPGLVPVYQQWSVVTFSSVRACFGLPHLWLLSVLFVSRIVFSKLLNAL